MSHPDPHRRPAAPPPTCEDCGGPRAERRAQYCWACYSARRRAGLTRAPVPEPLPDPPGPARCGACGQVFRAWAVREAHTSAGLRCFVGPELAARGWRQDARGVWEFPAPERVQRNSRAAALVEEG